MKGYKVVKADDGRLESATFMENPVEYTPGEWTTRKEKCGPLTVFVTIDTAERYMRNLIDRWEYELWECEFEPSKEDKVWAPYLHTMGVNGMRFQYPMIRVSEQFPAGTLLADKVKLVRRLKLKATQRSRRECDENGIQGGKEGL